MDDFARTYGRSAELARRERAIGQLSAQFLLDQATIGVSGLGATDALLVMAINQANIAPLTRDPVARSQHGGLDAPADDGQRRPVSISAVATSLRLPFETARRHVRKLEAAGVCVVSERGVIVPGAFLSSPAYVASVTQANTRLRGFYADLAADNLLEPLPQSRFPFEEGVPLRAAARLLADYLLRTAELLRAKVGDLMPALVLVAVLARMGEGKGEATTVAAAARRLGMPDETARRHAGKLIDQGHCVRTEHGLIIPNHTFASTPLLDLFHHNATNVQRLFAGLAERGVIAAWADAAR